MWPTEFFLHIYDKLTKRGMLREYNNLIKTRNYNQALIKKYQEDRLKTMLEYIKECVPFYKSIFNKRKIDLRRADPFYTLRKLPILTKADIKDNFSSLISKNYFNTRNISFDYTSGSTGQPLEFAFENKYKDIRWAIIYYNMNWIGYKFGDSHAYLYGSSLDYKKDISLRNKAQHLIMNSIIENVYHLNEDKLNHFIFLLKRKKISHLIGYASALITLAKLIKDRNIKKKDAFALKSVISTAEYLSESCRSEIEEALECKVYNRYGCREVGNIAHECSFRNGLHINWQNIFVEIIDKENVYIPYDNHCKEGEIIITCLNNHAMPFIRYNTGDLGVFFKHSCLCSNKSPLLNITSGRVLDQFYNSRGEIISGFNFSRLAMKFKKIRQIQFIQNSFNDFTVIIVKSQNDIQDEMNLINAKFKELFGEGVSINCKFVNKIEKEKSGKYRYTKCLLTPQK